MAIFLGKHRWLGYPEAGPIYSSVGESLMITHSRSRFALVAILVAAAVTMTSSAAYSAVVPRTILKSYFETGDVPTQDQFSNLIDSYIHQTDDGLTLVGIGMVPDSTARGFAIRANGNVGINEVLPDTFAGDWGGPYSTPSGLSLPKMCDEFCGETGYLPLKYSNSTGTDMHYGFLRITMENDPGTSPGPAIFVHGWAWESSANTAITTFAVPEPTAAVLLVAATSVLARRRGRRRD
jgi:hypothetical protein